MTEEEIREFIETVGPSLEAVFPYWGKGKREMLMARLARSTIDFEFEIESARVRAALQQRVEDLLKEQELDNGR